ncbi:MAG TPA: PQQ-binding-like beta-propeller repeat protein [Pyrinomonadaceae bacterium]|nr:PQQ-binding-like beta-propeller repeat protein [Pyrinomonadaceae bacterium]
MFEQQPDRAASSWYRSPAILLPVAVLAVALIALAAYMFTQRRDPGEDARYDALERHRAEQQQQAAAQPGAPAEPSAAPAADGQAPAASGEQTQAPGEQAAAGSPAASSSGGGARNYWTNFRGPARDGRYDERTVKTAWPASGLPLLWKQPIGGGFSSFSVADGTAYTIEQRRGQEVVAAYNAANGRELWTHKWDAEFRDSTGDGPRSTPTWDEGRVYALGATGELRCLDARTGRAIWGKNILSDNGASNLRWGIAASPLVVDDKVIVIAGGADGKSVVAYNKLTGARAWGAMSDPGSYTSPMLVNLAGRRQVLVVTERNIAGIAPEDGAVLWTHPWRNDAGINISQPIVVGPNRLFLSAGYQKGASLLEVANTGGRLVPRALWENASMKNKFNSSVYHDGYVYGLDEGLLSCVEVATGERKWKARGYGYGQVVLASGHLIITTDEGEIALVRATPDAHAEVARFPALQGKTWNVPAIADGRLLVRNGTEMAAFKLTD